MAATKVSATTTAKSLATTLSRDHHDELQRLRQLLHLLFHRNKNQHRRSAWWRFFAGFRRELGRFLDEADRAAELDAVVVPSKKQKKTRQELRERREMRLKLWRDRLVERWYL
jgi:ribonuclease MRP protein subunit RMP1